MDSVSITEYQWDVAPQHSLIEVESFSPGDGGNMFLQNINKLLQI
jgi:hypothetical protein